MKTILKQIKEIEKKWESNPRNSKEHINAQKELRAIFNLLKQIDNKYTVSPLGNRGRRLGEYDNDPYYADD